MKEPTRLIQGEGSALERLFLSHAAQEEPSDTASAMLLAPLFSPIALGSPQDGAAFPPAHLPPPAGPTVQDAGRPSPEMGAGSASMHPGALLAAGHGVAWFGAGVLALGLVALGIAQFTPRRDTANSGEIRTSVQGPALLSSPQRLPSMQLQTSSQHTDSPQNEHASETKFSRSGSAPSGPAAMMKTPPPVAGQLAETARPLTLYTGSPVYSDQAVKTGSSVNTGSSVVRQADNPQPTLQPEVATKSLTTSRVASLRDELALLEQARTALRAEQPETALRRLARYDERFPEGALREEALVLRLEALKASGQDAAVGELRTQFLLDHPDSPHQARVENTSPK